MNKPNVLLLTIDALRPDMLGCYGHDHLITPNVDRLAGSGICFAQAITGGSWTQAAFPVLLTSTYASMYGGCLGSLSPQRPSPVEVLAEHGYATAGFSTSPLLSKAYGYDRGFDYFVDLNPAESDPLLRRIKGGQRLLRSPLIHHLAGMVGKRLRPARLYAPAAEVVDAVCHWLEEVKSPFFVWAHFMDTHWPYHLEDTLVHPRDIAQMWRDLAHLYAANWKDSSISAVQQAHYIHLYEQALQYVDAQIGRLLAYLEKTEGASNTIVVITSDHGEEFLEHGRWGHWENNLYDEILRVPLIMRLPGQKQGTTIRRQVRTLDLMPTILDLCGVPPAEGMEGTSLRPLWESDGLLDDSLVSISEMPREHWHRVALRTERFKLIWDSHTSDTPELYDLQADPGEQKNVASQHPQVVRRFRSLLEAHLERVDMSQTAPPLEEPDLDAAVLERLRGLGYIE
jgi:arylsulfatase A-like enzyme